MKIRITKWGNSLALRIPRPLALESEVEEGTVVEISVVEGRIVIQRASETEPSLDELLERVTDENLHAETDTGPPRGREAW